MKKYLIIFLILLTGLSFWAVWNQYSRQEFWRVRDMEREFSEVFMIPNLSDSEALRSYTNVYPLLFETAEKFGANIFRTSQVTENEINNFILLTNETEFFNHLTLKSGKQLSMADTKSGLNFLSTIETGDPNQMGRVTYFGNQAAMTIAPIVIAFQTLPVARRYFVELPAGIELEAFLQ